MKFGRPVRVLFDLPTPEIGNAPIVLGIVGAVVGGLLFGLLGISTSGLIGSIITATVGAVVLLLVVRLFKKA